LKVLKDKKILVATPGRLESQSIQNQLQNLGAQVDGLATTKLAVQHLVQNQMYRQVILDVQSMDDQSFKLLTDEAFRYPKEDIIILLPPLHRRYDIENFSKIGIHKFMYKPFSSEKFLELLRKKKDESENSLFAHTSRFNILVVDDDFENRQLIEQFMSQTKYEVHFAKDGFEALHLASQKSFDVVLMDIEMPGMNGYETAQKLKALEICKNTKILGLSANAFPENFTEAKEAGFAGYITKPITKRGLLTSIVECVKSEQFYELDMEVG